MMKIPFLVLIVAAVVLGQPQDAQPMDGVDPTGAPQRTQGYGFTTDDPIWKFVSPFRIPGDPRQFVQDINLVWGMYLKDTTGSLDLYGMLGWNFFGSGRWQVAVALGVNQVASEPIVVIGTNATVRSGSVLQYQVTTMVQEDSTVDVIWGIYSADAAGSSRSLYPLSSMHLSNLPLEGMPQYALGAIVQTETDNSAGSKDFGEIVESVFMKKKAKKVTGPQDFANLFKAAGHTPVKVTSLTMDQIEELKFLDLLGSKKAKVGTGRRLQQFRPPNAGFSPREISPNFFKPPQFSFSPRELPPPRSFFPPRAPGNDGFPPSWIPLRAPKADPPPALSKCAIWPAQAVVFNDIQVFGEQDTPLKLNVKDFNEGTIPDDECTSLSATELTAPENGLKISFIYDNGATGSPLAPETATTPIQKGCCASAADCGETGIPVTGTSFLCIIPEKSTTGVCKMSFPFKGYCWDSTQCDAGQTCTGASVCPCGARCFSPDRPGKCQ